MRVRSPGCCSPAPSLARVTGSLALEAALDRRALYVLVVAAYVALFVLLAAVPRRGMGVGVA